MTASLEQLVDGLRSELQQYGEMLALLEAQQDVVLRCEPRSVLMSVSAVEAQSAAIHAARGHRESCQRQLAVALGWPENETFPQLLSSIPDEYRPLIQALVQEINELLRRVRERADQNHAQLRCSLELMERFISTLSLQAQPALLVGEKDSPGADQPSPPRALPPACHL